MKIKFSDVSSSYPTCMKKLQPPNKPFLKTLLQKHVRYMDTKITHLKKAIKESKRISRSFAAKKGWHTRRIKAIVKMMIDHIHGKPS